MIPFLFSRSRYRRKFGSRVHPECVPTVVEGWQQQPTHFTVPSLAIAELEVDGPRLQRPEIPMAIDFAEVLLIEQPGRSDPALHHLPIAPAGDVRRAARHIALRTLDHIGCGKAFVQRRWQLSHCKVNISPRQRFVCVETVLGEVWEWIVGYSSRARRNRRAARAVSLFMLEMRKEHCRRSCPIRMKIEN